MRPQPGAGRWPSRPRALDSEFQLALRDALLAAIDGWFPESLRPKVSPMPLLVREMNSPTPFTFRRTSRLKRASTGHSGTVSFALSTNCVNSNDVERLRTRGTCYVTSSRPRHGTQANVQGRGQRRLCDSSGFWRANPPQRAGTLGGGTPSGDRECLLDDDRPDAGFVQGTSSGASDAMPDLHDAGTVSEPATCPWRNQGITVT